VPGATLFAFMPQDQGQWTAGWAMLGPSSRAEVLGDTVIFGDPVSRELEYRLADGSVVRRVVLPIERPAEIGPLLAAAREAALARLPPGEGRGYTEAMYDAPRPPVYYVSFLVATDGDIWVRLHEEFPGGPPRYLVLTPAGAVRARVPLPPTRLIFGVERPWVLVVLLDADDVERRAVVEWEGS
jgi:hypothetical protein